jgi:luciferase family oxidoreductase group 1
LLSTLSATAFSILDLVSIRADGSPAAALRASLELARQAERLGYKRFWLAEHHNMDGVASSATAVLVGYIAAGTATIRVGSGGVMLPNHAPLIVAENFGTLATVYPGRIDLGLGRAPGADQATMRALRRERLGDGDDFPDQVAELRALLAPARPGKRLIAMPGVGTEVPIWILGSSLFGAQLAAQMGLPYAYASHFAPRYLHAAIKIYREQFKPSAALGKPYVMLGIPLVAAPSDEEAEFLATTAQQRILALLRGQSLAMQPPTEDMDKLWLPQEKSAVADFLGAAIVGGPQTVKAKLDQLLLQTEADELMFVSNFHDPAHHLRCCEIVASLRTPD